MTDPEGATPAPAGGAPPLGARPAEPLPGKASLADPEGKAAAQTEDGKGGGVCPDCGLPFGDHPDFAGHHDPALAHRAHGGHLPGEELDPRSLGGDPAED